MHFRFWCGCRTVRVGVLIREKGLMKDHSLNNKATNWFWECLVEIWTGQIIGRAIIFRYLCTLLCCRLIPAVRYCESGNNPTAWLTCLKQGEIIRFDKAIRIKFLWLSSIDCIRTRRDRHISMHVCACTHTYPYMSYLLPFMLCTTLGFCQQEGCYQMNPSYLWSDCKWNKPLYFLIYPVYGAM